MGSRLSRLVTVHHINGQHMEKYYIIGSTLLCLALSVPPLDGINRVQLVGTRILTPSSLYECIG